MTLNELKSAVSALLSETVSERDPIFIGAANRSLEMLFAELPSKKLLTLPVPRFSSSVLAEKIEHRGGEKISVALSGAAYSFKVAGAGSYTVRDGAGALTKDFDTRLSTIRGFIKGSAGEITFEGDYYYTVFSLTVFDGVMGGSLSDIPDTEGKITVRTDDYADDILSLRGMPKDSSARLISGAEIVGRSVVFPIDFSGLATITYDRRPVPITESTAEIDTEPDAATALPLFTAYFLTLERDAELAAEFLSLAKGLVNGLLCRRVNQSTEYTDVTGWA